MAHLQSFYFHPWGLTKELLCTMISSVNINVIGFLLMCFSKHVAQCQCFLVLAAG